MFVRNRAPQTCCRILRDGLSELEFFFRMRFLVIVVCGPLSLRLDTAHDSRPASNQVEEIMCGVSACI